LAGLRAAWPALAVDEEAVRFGAATHDLGKTLHPAELNGPGRRHERDGPALLEREGVAPELARFARSHGAWQTEPAALEDLLVALADACWKGARRQELESALGELIAARLGADRWAVWLALDDLIESVAAGADRRLAWHNQFPIAPPS
ncbi:MAG TPA: HD domain-containing protein, partial [Herpetosiphonaceae bacterium]